MAEVADLNRQEVPGLNTCGFNPPQICHILKKLKITFLESHIVTLWTLTSESLSRLWTLQGHRTTSRRACVRLCCLFRFLSFTSAGLWVQCVRSGFRRSGVGWVQTGAAAVIFWDCLAWSHFSRRNVGVPVFSPPLRPPG